MAVSTDDLQVEYPPLAPGPGSLDNVPGCPYRFSLYRWPTLPEARNPCSHLWIDELSGGAAQDFLLLSGFSSWAPRPPNAHRPGNGPALVLPPRGLLANFSVLYLLPVPRYAFLLPSDDIHFSLHQVRLCKIIDKITPK